MNAPPRPLALTATPYGALAVSDERHTPPRLPNPDAELLTACAAFDALERAYLALGFGHDEEMPEGAAIEAEQSRLAGEQEPLVARICELRAVTRVGQAARARSLALWDAELMKPKGDIAGRLIQAIVRDLLDERAGA